MSFWRSKTMEMLEKRLALQGEYREDQNGYPWIANRSLGQPQPGQDLDPGWYEAPPLAEDWHRLYSALHALLEKHPQLMEELTELK